jgi:hypothetical protein
MAGVFCPFSIRFGRVPCGISFSRGIVRRIIFVVDARTFARRVACRSPMKKEHRIPTNGEYAKALRGNRSQEDVALDAGVTQRIVMQIESGQGTIEECLRKVAAYYGVEYEDLFAGSNSQPNPRPEPSRPIDNTVTLNIELRGGRREALAITIGFEDAAQSEFRINLRDFRTGSLVLDIRLARSDFWRLVEAFGNGRFDDFNVESITLSTYCLLLLVATPYLAIGAAVAVWLPPMLATAAAALVAALAHLRSRIPNTLTVDVTTSRVIIRKRPPSNSTPESPSDPPQTKNVSTESPSFSRRGIGVDR